MWTTERVALLKNRIAAGLSCAEVARELEVSRNAVIGKANRLGLSRLKSMTAGQPARSDNAKIAGLERPRAKSPRQGIVTPHQIAQALRRKPRLPFAEVPVDIANRCSLLELQQGQCRWPISEPGAQDFGFCGSERAQGVPYCAGHARMAYRPGTRVNLHHRERVAPAELFERPLL
jgi:GcrA cell cycle regulator